MVDVLGLVSGSYVTSGNTADVKAAKVLFVWVLDLFKRIGKVVADRGYQGALGGLIKTFFTPLKRQVVALD